MLTVVGRQEQLQILWEGLIEEVLSLDERLADRAIFELHQLEVPSDLVPVAL